MMNKKISAVKERETKIVHLSPEYRVALQDFFSIIGSDSETLEKFTPHDFTKEEAVKIASQVGPNIYLITLEGNSIVAYGMLRFSEGYSDPTLGIVVHPNCRNQGLGGKMIDCLHKEAKDVNLRSITLFVNKDNPAQHLYVRKGYIFTPATRKSRSGKKELKGIFKIE